MRKINREVWMNDAKLYRITATLLLIMVIGAAVIGALMGRVVG